MATYREIEILFWESSYPAGYKPNPTMTIHADGSKSYSKGKPYEDLPEWVRNVIPKAKANDPQPL